MEDYCSSEQEDTEVKFCHVDWLGTSGPKLTGEELLGNRFSKAKSEILNGIFVLFVTEMPE